MSAGDEGGGGGHLMHWRLNEKEKGKLLRTLVEFLALPTGDGGGQSSTSLILALGDLTEVSVLLYSILIPTPGYTVYSKL